MGRKNGIRSLLAYGASKDLIFSPYTTAKNNDKSKFLRKMVSSGISDVVIASVYSDKTRLKELMKMIIINPQHACARGLQ